MHKDWPEMARELSGAIKGETLLVIGAGPIGLLALQVLLLNGAGKVFIADLDAERPRRRVGGHVVASEIATRGVVLREGQRVRVQGPETRIASRAAMALALAIHELATNALKYGALSVPQGRVRVDWSREADSLVLRWRECCGPSIAAPPARHGFGSRLIADVPRGKLRAEVAADYAADGLRWELRCPATE